jgi:V/A-type H+/Na+-transporting ATPase subunit K
MYIILTLTVFIVVSTIAAGLVIRYKEYYLNKKHARTLVLGSISTLIPILAGAVILMIPQVAHAADGTSITSSSWGFIAAALTTGFATMSTGYAVGAVGSSALGAVSENPNILGKTLIFVGLAEGIAIYGLIVSIMILGKL